MRQGSDCPCHELATLQHSGRWLSRDLSSTPIQIGRMSLEEDIDSFFRGHPFALGGWCSCGKGRLTAPAGTSCFHFSWAPPITYPCLPEYRLVRAQSLCFLWCLKSLGFMQRRVCPWGQRPSTNIMPDVQAESRQLSLQPFWNPTLTSKEEKSIHVFLLQDHGNDACINLFLSSPHGTAPLF